MNITVYDILITEQNRYRILCIQEEYVVGCKLDTTKLILEYISLADIKENLLSGKWSVENSTGSSVVDTSYMEEGIKSKFTLYKQCMREVADIYGPSFTGLTGKSTKREATEIMTKYGLKPFVFWKICRNYLQSGCDDNSLVDKRAVGFAHRDKEYEYSKRTGRPVEYGEQSEVIIDGSVRVRFAEALKAYKSGRHTTYKGAYVQNPA